MCNFGTYAAYEPPSQTYHGQGTIHPRPDQGQDTPLPPPPQNTRACSPEDAADQNQPQVKTWSNLTPKEMEDIAKVLVECEKMRGVKMVVTTSTQESEG